MLREALPLTLKAAIFTQAGLPEQKQHQACLDFINANHWQLLHVIPFWAPTDAVKLVAAGVVDVIVAAFNSRTVRRLAESIGNRGQVYYVHPTPTLVSPPPATMPGSLPDLIVRWFRRGRAPRDIAADIGSTTRDVRDILRRAGEDPG
jgi:hypothetical protein